MATKKARRWHNDEKFVEWMKTMGYADEDGKRMLSEGGTIYMWEAWRGALGEDVAGPDARKARERARAKKAKGKGRRVLVTGGQRYTDESKVFAVLSLLNRKGISILIAGPADGADAFARAWAEQNDIELEIITEKGGAGNQKRIEAGPQVVVAFPGGGGRADMVKRAKVAKIKVLEVT